MLPIDSFFLYAYLYNEKMISISDILSCCSTNKSKIATRQFILSQPFWQLRILKNGLYSRAFQIISTESVRNLKNLAIARAESKDPSAIRGALKIAVLFLEGKDQAEALQNIALKRASQGGLIAFEDGFDIANHIPVPDFLRIRSSALSSVISLRAQMSDLHAPNDVRVMLPLIYLEHRNEVQACLAIAQAKKDEKNSIEKALGIASKITDYALRLSTIGKIALEQARKGNNGSLHRKALKIIDELLGTIPEAASFQVEIIQHRASLPGLCSIDGALYIAKQIRDKTTRSRAIGKIAVERAKKEDKDAVDDALNLEVNHYDICEIAVIQAEKKDKHAINKALDILMLVPLKSTTSPVLREKINHALLTIAKIQAEHDIYKALNIIRFIPDSAISNQGYHSIALIKAKHTEANAIKMALSIVLMIRDPKLYALAVGNIAVEQLKKNESNAFHRSMAIAKMIKDPLERCKILIQLADNCKERHLPVFDNSTNIIRSVYQYIQ